ncbi:MAG UNVERIFIED_CONTAM: type II secretion system F family protein [Planctomycetaceae bacterium]|jgi:type IV pilus assembly protein PilC
MSLMRRWLYFRNRPEPLRQATLLLMLAGAAGRGESLLVLLRAQARVTRGEWSEQLQQLATLLDSGHTLSTALSLVGDLLPPHITAAIAATESSGCLSSVLRDEAERLIRQMTESAGNSGTFMMTAAATGGVFVVIAGVVNYRMADKFVEIFGGFRTELPALTLAFFDATQIFFENWTFLSFPVCCLTAWGSWYFWRDSRHRQTHGCPLYAHLMPRYWVPGLLRIFSTSAAAGVPLIPCVQATVQQLPAGRACDHLLQLTEYLKQGEQIPAALRHAGLLSTRDAAFLESAFAAGHPDWGMRQLADQLEERRLRRARRRRVLLACGMQAAVSLLVLWFALACFMPLIKLVNNLS